MSILIKDILILLAKQKPWIFFFILGVVLNNVERPPEKRASFNCLIKRCLDGDTCELQSPSGVKVRLRLFGIDAPEWGYHGGQSYGKESTLQINELTRNRALICEDYGIDIYGRKLVVITTDEGVNLNEYLVREGYAFAYQGKSTPSWAKEAQKSARQMKKGLWGLKMTPQNPRLYRQTRG